MENALILSDSDLEELAQELEQLDFIIQSATYGADIENELQRVEEIVRAVEISQKTICSTQKVIQIF